MDEQKKNRAQRDCSLISIDQFSREQRIELIHFNPAIEEKEKKEKGQQSTSRTTKVDTGHKSGRSAE